MMAVIWGTPTPATTRVVQIEPGPDAHLDRVGARRRSGPRPPRAVAMLPARTWVSGYFFLMARTMSEDVAAVAVGGVDDQQVDAGLDQQVGAQHGVRPHADGRGHPQAARLVLAGVGDSPASSGCP